MIHKGNHLVVAEYFVQVLWWQPGFEDGLPNPPMIVSNY